MLAGTKKMAGALGWMCLSLSACAASAGSSAEPKTDRAALPNPWAGRSGEAEALADIAAGRPIKLYYQWIAGERAIMRTPGLRNCNPDRFDVSEDARSKFVAIGADYSESIRYTEEELARFDSATLFARAYNLTIFSKKTAEVMKICPAVVRD